MNPLELLQTTLGPVIGLGLLMGSAILLVMSKTHRLEENDRREALRHLRLYALLVEHGVFPMKVLLEEMKELNTFLSEIPDDNLITRVLEKKIGA